MGALDGHKWHAMIETPWVLRYEGEALHPSIDDAFAVLEAMFEDHSDVIEEDPQGFIDALMSELCRPTV
jgi:hypothetical protein